MKTGKIYAVKVGREIIPALLLNKGRHKYFDSDGNEMPAEKSFACTTWTPPVYAWQDAFGEKFYSGYDAIQPGYFNWHSGREAAK